MSDYLPRELVIEILLKLPSKSLLRFTAVCKLWHSIITSSGFIFSHLAICASKEDESLFLRRYTKEDRAEHYTILKDGENQPFLFDELYFPFKSQVGYFRIVGGSNGLVCLSDDFFTNPYQPIILWNPCIRKHILLPAPTIKPENAHFFVLGCGSTRRDFKVVRMVYSKTNDFTLNLPAMVEIYSLNSGTWRRVHFDDLYVVLEFMWSQAFIQGTVHWLAFQEDHTQNKSFCSLILTFQMEDEVFGVLNLPGDLTREAVTDLSITVIGESLGVIKYDKQMGSESCCVWAMKVYGDINSWTKLCSMSLVEQIEKVIGFRKNGKVLLAATQEHELVSYDPETRMIKNLGIHGSPRSFFIGNYTESLLLLVGQNVVADQELLTISSHSSQSSNAVEDRGLSMICTLALRQQKKKKKMCTPTASMNSLSSWVKIDSPTLQNMFWSCNTITQESLLQNLTSLRKAFVGFFVLQDDLSGTKLQSLSNFMSGISHCRSLTLEYQCIEILSKNNRFSLHPFTKLESLELYTGLNKHNNPGLVSLFRVSPAIHTVVIKIVDGKRKQWNKELWDLSSSGEERYWESQTEALKCFLLHLKMVKIHGFVECANDISLVKFLLKNGKALKELFLCTSLSKPRDSLLREKIRSQIMGFSRASSGAKIVFQ